VFFVLLSDILSIYLSQTFLSSMSAFAPWYEAAGERFIALVVMYGIYTGGYNAHIFKTITDIYIWGEELLTREPLPRSGSLLCAGLILATHTRGGVTIELTGQLALRACGVRRAAFVRCRDVRGRHAVARCAR